MNMHEECSLIRKCFSAALDAETPACARQEIEAHLAACPACRAEWAAWRQLSNDLQCWTAPDVRPELSARFAERLAARVQRRNIWQRLFFSLGPRTGWALGAAAAAVLVVCVLCYERPSHVTQAPPLADRSVVEASRPSAIAAEEPAVYGSAQATPPTSSTQQPQARAARMPARIVRKASAGRPAAGMPTALPKTAPIGTAMDEETLPDATQTAVQVLNETALLVDGQILPFAGEHRMEYSAHGADDYWAAARRDAAAGDSEDSPLAETMEAGMADPPAAAILFALIADLR